MSEDHKDGRGGIEEFLGRQSPKFLSDLSKEARNATFGGRVSSAISNMEMGMGDKIFWIALTMFGVGIPLIVNSAFWGGLLMGVGILGLFYSLWRHIQPAYSYRLWIVVAAMLIAILVTGYDIYDRQIGARTSPHSKSTNKAADRLIADPYIYWNGGVGFVTLRGQYRRGGTALSAYVSYKGLGDYPSSPESVIGFTIGGDEAGKEIDSVERFVEGTEVKIVVGSVTETNGKQLEIAMGAGSLSQYKS